MRESYRIDQEKLCAAILESPGDSSTALRTQIEAYSEQSGRNAEADNKNIPSELLPYINRVTRFAYKVTDEDIATLKDLGYSEDALFEITLSVALGAGMVRLDSGLMALKGAVDATQKH